MPFDLTEEVMAQHKFRVGQMVNYRSGVLDRGGSSGVYKVTRLLPSEGDDHHYQIKNANELHERVVKESQLNRVA
jgi:hypothetical protein